MGATVRAPSCVMLTFFDSVLSISRALQGSESTRPLRNPAVQAEFGPTLHRDKQAAKLPGGGRAVRVCGLAGSPPLQDLTKERRTRGRRRERGRGVMGRGAWSVEQNVGQARRALPRLRLKCRLLSALRSEESQRGETLTCPHPHTQSGGQDWRGPRGMWDDGTMGAGEGQVATFLFLFPHGHRRRPLLFLRSLVGRWGLNC